MPITYAVTFKHMFDGRTETRLIDSFSSMTAVMVLRRTVPDALIIRAVPYIPA